jgi:SAM-dependent methyltransferase
VTGRDLPLPLLAAAYDRSAAGYDERFRPLQREKYQAALGLLAPWLSEASAAEALSGGLLVDAGGGTGLFKEWLDDAAGPHLRLRRHLSAARHLCLDLSLAMVQRSRARGCLPVCADLARPPLRPRCAVLVVAFTSVLGAVEASLAALGELVAPGGALLVSFLSAESPAPTLVAGCSGLGYVASARAGQDELHLLLRPGPTAR